MRIQSISGNNACQAFILTSLASGHVIVSVALASILAVGAYFCIIHGFNMYDMAMNSLQAFGGGFLMYLGACAAGLSLIHLAVGVIAPAVQLVTYNEDLSSKAAGFAMTSALQVGGTLLAPVIIFILLMSCAIFSCIAAAGR